MHHLSKQRYRIWAADLQSKQGEAAGRQIAAATNPPPDAVSDDAAAAGADSLRPPRNGRIIDKTKPCQRSVFARWAQTMAPGLPHWCQPKSSRATVSRSRKPLLLLEDIVCVEHDVENL